MFVKRLLGASLCAVAITSVTNAQADTAPSLAQTGDIIVVGFPFCPPTWVEADGSLLPISQYSQLFSVYGTTYGGNGRTTFGVPDFRSRMIVHQGTGEGLSPMPIGERGGLWMGILGFASLPEHSHAVLGSSQANNVASPANASFADFTGAPLSAYNAPADTAMDNDIVSVTGGEQPFYTLAPSLGLLACVQLYGSYPSRQ